MPDLAAHPTPLDRFIRELHDVLAARTPDGSPARAMITATDAVLAGGLVDQRSTVSDTGSTLPATRYFPTAISTARRLPLMGALIESLEALIPELAWARRPTMAGAGPEFADGHANAVAVGEGGLVANARVTVGLTVMAPHVLYADHSHPPAEVYLVLSPGEWRQRSRAWFAPGAGQTVYNPPGITHAMRSGDVPLLTIWTLLGRSGRSIDRHEHQDARSGSFDSVTGE